LLYPPHVRNAQTSVGGPASSSAVAQPTLQVATVHDPQDEKNLVIRQDVVHDPPVTNPDSMEITFGPTNRLERLAMMAARIASRSRRGSESY